MRGIAAQWVLREPDLSDRPATPEFSGTGGPLSDRVVRARELDPPVRFQDGGYAQIRPPESLAGALDAGRVLADRLRNGTKIVIHGDYDFDGIAASSILQRGCLRMAPAADIEVVLPNRYETGYGLSEEGVQALVDRGVKLIVTVDCGITAHDPIALARSQGVDVVVVDHHTIPRNEVGEIDLPDADVVVHPHLPSPEDEMPVGDLCGAALAFKVLWATARIFFGSDRLPEVMKRELVEATILAGLGTIADVMPLVGENRALATLCLRSLPGTSLVGLRSLLAESGYDQATGPVHEELVQFQLAPRINALGRLGSARPAIELLCDLDDDDRGRRRAVELAAAISEVNKTRRSEESRIVEEAMARAESEGQTADDHPMIVLSSPDWKRGLVGPACAKLVDRFSRPVVLLEEGPDGIARGSARSIDGYSIHDGLEAAAHVLERYGGHAAAAGCTVEVSKIEDLRLALVDHARRSMSDRVGGFEPTIAIDCRAAVKEIASIDHINELRSLAPFGQGHARPTMLVETVHPVETRWVGASSDTLQMSFAVEGNRLVKAVWFRAGRHRKAVEEAIRRGPLDLVVTPDLDTWGGRTRPKLMVSDIRPSGVDSDQSTTS